MSKVDVSKLSVTTRINYLQEAAEELGYQHWSDVPEDETDSLMKKLESDYEEDEDETI